MATVDDACRPADAQTSELIVPDDGCVAIREFPRPNSRPGVLLSTWDDGVRVYVDSPFAHHPVVTMVDDEDRLVCQYVSLRDARVMARNDEEKGATLSETAKLIIGDRR